MLALAAWQPTSGKWLPGGDNDAPSLMHTCGSKSFASYQIDLEDAYRRLKNDYLITLLTISQSVSAELSVLLHESGICVVGPGGSAITNAYVVKIAWFQQNRARRQGIDMAVSTVKLVFSELALLF